GRRGGVGARARARARVLALRAQVAHGKAVHDVRVSAAATVGQLKEKLAELTKVPVAGQKLMKTGRSAPRASALVGVAGVRVAWALARTVMCGPAARSRTSAQAGRRDAGGREDRGQRETAAHRRDRRGGRLDPRGRADRVNRGERLRGERGAVAAAARADR